MVEYADNSRSDDSARTGPFPAAWGPPPADPAERRRWIAFHARRAEWRTRQAQGVEAKRRALEFKRECP